MRPTGDKFEHTTCMYDGLVILENGDFDFFTGKNNDSFTNPITDDFSKSFYDDYDPNLDFILKHGK